MLRSFVEPSLYDAWHSAIRRTHRRVIEVRVLDLDHRLIHMLPTIIDGQRDIDVTEAPTRHVSLTAFDPGRTIDWEPNGANDFDYLRRMVQVFDCRLVPDVGWIDCPVFTGPVASVVRDGAEVSIEADGKERLAMGNFAQNHSWSRKRRGVEVIREILELAGEHPSRIHLPPLKTTLPEALIAPRGDFVSPYNPGTLRQPGDPARDRGSRFAAKRGQTHWGLAQKVARSMGYYLFYDGLGHVRMRKAPTAAVLAIGSDVLMSAPRATGSSLDDIHNRWIVQGPAPKGNKTRVGATIALPARHDLSAQTLGRNGVPRWLDETSTESQLKTSAAALRFVKEKRDEQMRVTRELSAESLPIPNFEEFDLIKIVDPATGERPHLRLKQETLPLVSGEQSLGTVRRVSLSSGKGGRARHWGGLPMIPKGGVKLYHKGKKGGKK